MKTPRLPSLTAFRASILATMGLTACGSSVSTPGGGGAGGNGTTSTTTTGATTSSTTGTTTTGTTTTGTTTTGSTTTTGTTTTSTTTTSTTTTTTTTTTSAVCVNPTPIVGADGTDSGFVRCADGTILREEAVPCDPNVGIVPCEGTEMLLDCKDDTGCAGVPNGRCASVVQSTFGGLQTACQCVSPCKDDAECGPGQACICAGTLTADVSHSFCASAGCLTGAACPNGECAASAYNNGCWTDVELACHSAADQCQTDADCVSLPGTTCVIPGPGLPWQCLGDNCAIGRPLVVDGKARTAPAIDRDDWQAAIEPRVDHLDREARAALAAHWVDVAALEHASIASFSRFTLELLALGAPSHLVADAQRAALDEVEHARIAYAIASVYAGHHVGPDALDLARVPLHTDRRGVIQSLIGEACVGETLGVAEALEIASIVRDPALREAHARIAADEQRHAELAWRTLAWLLSDRDEDTMRFAARCFDEAIAGASRDPLPRDPSMTALGLLSSAAIGAVRRRALTEVVTPCAAALLAPLPSSTAQGPAIALT